MDVSVVIPCHNAAEWLAQTLGSLLEQTLLPGRVVVVDDASTDASAEVAARFVAHDPDRFELISPAEGGNAPRARNLGAERVGAGGGGGALMFLDADDVLHPETLGALVEALGAGGPGGEGGEGGRGGRGWRYARGGGWSWTGSGRKGWRRVRRGGGGCRGRRRAG